LQRHFCGRGGGVTEAAAFSVLFEPGVYPVLHVCSDITDIRSRRCHTGPIGACSV